MPIRTPDLMVQEGVGWGRTGGCLLQRNKAAGDGKNPPRLPRHVCVRGLQGSDPEGVMMFLAFAVTV
jgi:hypothetical protein